jgi:putative ABC transport system permease protein
MDTTVHLPGGELTNSRHTQVDYGLLELYGLTPIAGRFFSRAFETDEIADPARPENPSIVVNETALGRLRLGTAEEAIGKTVNWERSVNHRAGRPFEPRPSTVIGVVRDFQFRSIRAPVESQIYYIDPAFFSTVSVKLDGARVPETLAALDSLARRRGQRPPDRVFLDEYMQRQYVDVTRQAATFASFAGLTLFIACIGLLGLATFNAERRTKEVGIRKSMGAGPAQILRLLTWEFARPVLIANLIAWPIAWFAMQRWLESFAYRIDLAPWMFLASGAAALAIAVITVSTQSLLVSRSKPVTALRYE